MSIPLPPPEVSDFDFLAMLDAQIAKATSKSKLESEKKKAQQAARGTVGQARINAMAEIKAINFELEAIQWKPLASVVLIAKQSCDGCGSTHEIFLQHMQRQETVFRPKVERWVRTMKVDHSLPKEVVFQTSISHCCVDCLGDFGFDLSSGLVKFARHSEPFSIPAGYTGESLEDLDS